jgi:hypothetical protein
MKKLLTLLLCAASFAASAASYVTVTNSFTNRTVSGDNFTAAGVTVRFTNAPLNSQTWIVTNSAKASATNLWRFLGRTQPALYVRMANETNVVISGNDLAFSISGGFGVLTTNSSLATNQTVVTIPWTILTPANQTNQADELLRGLSGYSYSNTFAADSHALTNFVGKTNAATLTRKTLTAPVVNGGTNAGVFITNTPAIYVTNIFAQVINPDGSTSVLSGAIIGGKFQFGSHTNLDWIDATNANIGTARIDTLTVWTAATITNLAAPGSGAGSLRIGSAAVASGLSSISIGDASSATNEGSVAFGPSANASGFFAMGIGYQANATGSNSLSFGVGASSVGAYSVAIGNNTLVNGFGSVGIGTGTETFYNNTVEIGSLASATGTNQIVLGSSQSVRAVGVFSPESGITNHETTGTNKFNARLDFTSRAVSSLVNGANSGIVLGSNVFVKLSGGSTVCALSGFQAAQDGTFHILHITGGITNVIINEANSTDYATDATAANRIVTGTGTNFYSTNSPLVLPVIYDAAASRWKIVSFMR